jgi:hypothetical protein
MDLKGKIESTSKRNKMSLIYLSAGDKRVKVSSRIEMESFPKGSWVNFVNIEYKRGLFNSKYLFNDNSFVVLHPNLCITYEEMNLALQNKYAPIIIAFASKEEESASLEKTFFNTMRGYIEGDEKSKPIAERLPKDIKAKFSFKTFEISTKFGFIIKDALYLGKLPIAFAENEMKAKIQAITSGSEKYILIEGEGTLREEKIDINEKQSLMAKRNALAQTFFADSHREILDSDCENSSPLYKYLSIIKEKPEEFDNFDRNLSSFLRDEYKRRVNFQKIMLSGVNPKRATVQIHSGAGNLFDFTAKISDNEGKLREDEYVVVVEKPPLDRKTLGKVEEISFDDIRIALDAPIVNGECITPIGNNPSPYRGLFPFVYSDTIVAKILKGETVASFTSLDNVYIEQDPEQNKAVNLILSPSPITIVKGENGTGKKFVAQKAIEELSKNNLKILVATDSRKYEFERIFGDSKDKVFTEKDRASYKGEELFDVAFLFIAHEPNQGFIKRVAAVSKKLVILISTDVKSEIESKIPNDCIVELLTEHRFGNHIMHFISPLIDNKITASADNELKVINKENIDSDFVPIVNPEKFVQFVSITPKIYRKKNQWNSSEAQFTAEAVAQFVKAGVERKSIEVIVPFERQKKLIEKLLFDKKIPDISVKEINGASESDIVFVNFVENDPIKSKFKEAHFLKFALTRAKSKLILVGSDNLKREKLLSRLVKK